ncbi:MAG: TIM44-like domain-containing protein [Fibrobacteria bacterium]
MLNKPSVIGFGRLRHLASTTWALISCACILVQARAGGGDAYNSGGDSYSGGGGSGGGGFSFDSYGSGSSGGSGGSASLGQIVLILILVILILYLKNKYSNSKQVDAFRKALDPELQSVLRRSPSSGSPAALRLQEKMGGIFVAIQTSWDKGKMDPVRAVLSDGVYNRFQIQLEMNRLQGMRNRVESPELLDAKILGEDVFGRYASIDFLVRGRVIDTDRRLGTDSVIRTGSSTFDEVWSFTRLARPADAPDQDGAQDPGNCPKCAAPLSDAGGSRCGHCGAVLNSGAYDWVLAEITQAEEWVSGSRDTLQPYYARLPAIAGADSKAWLSPQELEDRASVVFIRYQSALHRGSLAALTMFVAPELLRLLEGEKSQRPLYRLAVGAVDLLAFTETQGMVKAFVRVKYSGSEQPDQEGVFQERYLVFSKAAEAGMGKANLSSMTCPNCGGPIESSDQAKCAYCENILSSPAANWVLTEFGGRDLMAQAAAMRPQTPSGNNPSVAGIIAGIAGLAGMAASAKSAAHGQMRILSAIVSATLEDRVITPQEETTIRGFARHFGLGPIFVDMLLNKAKANPEALFEGVDKPTALTWINNLIFVAASDGRITPEEEALLLSFARLHGIEEKQVLFALKNASEGALKTAVKTKV